MDLIPTMALAVASVAVGLLLVIHRRVVRAIVLGTVDPRPLALFRVAFGLCLLGYIIEIAPLSTYLFSDEGLFPSEAVGLVYGRGALDGYGDGVRADPGFADLGGWLRHVAHGRWSLLYFWDEPAFVGGYLVAFALSCVGLIIGCGTRICAVSAWLLLTGLLRRGDAHWGGEQVFTGLLFALMFARSGAAFSVDAWRRGRSLRRRGRLDRSDSPTGGAGMAPTRAQPRGVAAIYPRVPAWPQVLLVVQLALCYGVNGWTKSGPTWVSGETLRLAVHLDNYTRLDWHGLVLALGPWPFRLATWSVMWWERLFPLVLVGLWLRASASASAPAVTGRGRRCSFGCGLVLAAALLVLASMPDALASSAAVATARAWALGVGAGVLVLAVVLGPRRGAPGRSMVERLTAPRGWLGFGVVFHATSVLLFEIGAFASATVSAYLVCGVGARVVAGVQRGTRALARLGVPLPEHLRCEHPVPAEDPALPHLQHDAAALPGGALAAAGVLVLVAAIVALHSATGSRGWWHGGWLVAAVGLSIVARCTAGRPGPPSESSSSPEDRPLAYGPAGRLAAGGVVAYHLVALLVWQLPAWPGLPWRAEARAMVDPWMELSFTRHLWSMFAPNGPRHNATVRTTIVDASGRMHDLRTELQHPENLRRPYIRHDRWRKVHEAVGGYRKWLAPWHARYLCRRWALDHHGAAPREVQLERVVAPFAPPRPLDSQTWFWEHARVVPIVRVKCASEPFAQLSPEVRARYGLPPPADGELHYAWPESPTRPDPLEPLWVALALGWSVAVWSWSRRSGA